MHRTLGASEVWFTGGLYTVRIAPRYGSPNLTDVRFDARLKLGLLHISLLEALNYKGSSISSFLLLFLFIPLQARGSGTDAEMRE